MRTLGAPTPSTLSDCATEKQVSLHEGCALIPIAAGAIEKKNRRLLMVRTRQHSDSRVEFLLLRETAGPYPLVRNASQYANPQSARKTPCAPKLGQLE